MALRWRTRRVNGEIGYFRNSIDDYIFRNPISEAAFVKDRELVRIQASVFGWNPSSARVLEKAGFAREGVLRQSVFKDGVLADSYLYARVR